MEAIILAGGLGTRLRSVVQNIPKGMAPIQGRPFLAYQLDYLIEQGVNRIIFSVGYLHECISNYFGREYNGCQIVYSVEESPLGTGGAIRQALHHCKDQNIWVLNGDTYCNVNLKDMLVFHRTHHADVSISLKSLKDTSRFGTVETDFSNRIVNFREKSKHYPNGQINTGIYLLNKDFSNGISFTEKFSFEKDFFERHTNNKKIFGFVSNPYFLDIGIPEDFELAQLEIGIIPKISKEWTLFLDRDGVINEKIPEDYVKSPQEFTWIPGVQDAIHFFSKIFGKIIVVTNQQGIGKGIMTENDLDKIHQHLLKELEAIGGRIDKIFYAPNLESENSILRKPGIGMALESKKVFPEIDFAKSIMIGDSKSDMEFARDAGMTGVLVNNNTYKHPYIYENMKVFSDKIYSILEYKNIF